MELENPPESPRSRQTLQFLALALMTE